MKNNKAFILTETLIVSAIVAFTLVILYSQFRKINITYNNSFKYNSSNDMFLLYNFKKFLVYENKITLTDNQYIDLTSCPSTYINDTNFCNQLVKDLGIKSIIYSEITCNSLKNDLSDLDYSNSFKLYVNKIDSAYSNGYRLLAEFNNGNFANIVIEGEK